MSTNTVVSILNENTEPFKARLKFEILYHYLYSIPLQNSFKKFFF
uniref:Uncharacterized protein n=1 Tax=Anguilla anguilla TaxID=7936 RepID=A0A0E9W1M8_ANGAN